MTAPDVIRFDTALACAASLAGAIADILRKGLASHGQASLVVPGGTTPQLFFHELAREKLDWSNVWVTVTDERWLEPSSPNSNEYGVRNHFLQAEASKARWIGLKNNQPSALAGLEQALARLKQMPRPCDAVVVGMGEDGHIASLFPGNVLPEAEASCTATRAPSGPPDRISLTSRSLLDTRRLFLLMGGPHKYAVLQRALQAGPAMKYPVRLLLQQRNVPVEIYYYAN